MDIGSSPSGSSRRAFLAGAAGLAGAMLLGGDAVFTASGLELLAAAEPAAAPAWNKSMKKEELLAVAHQLGLDVNSKSTKAQIIEALEQA